jgi:2,4-dienoyl-CoA reductase-like NADH-dependent reductase (Old Yellow Enzyme family)
MENTAQPLVAVIDAFLDERAISHVSFGRAAMNDPHFVRDLRKGRRVWPETEAKVRAFMANHAAPIEQKEAA